MWPSRIVRKQLQGLPNATRARPETPASSCASAELDPVADCVESTAWPATIPEGTCHWVWHRRSRGVLDRRAGLTLRPLSWPDVLGSLNGEVASVINGIFGRGACRERGVTPCYRAQSMIVPLWRFAQ